MTSCGSVGIMCWNYFSLRAVTSSRNSRTCLTLKQTQTCCIMFVFTDLTFWKGPDSTGALTASTLWPTSSFPRSWSLSTPTSPSTLEKTPVCPRGNYPSSWKQRTQSTNVAPARPGTNRRIGKRPKGLWRQTWLWSSLLVTRQNLLGRRGQMRQHRRRQVWWNRMRWITKRRHHICSIKWLRPFAGEHCRSALLWDIKYTSCLGSVQG